MNPPSSPLLSSRSLALVGCGYWGKNLARNFNALGSLRLLCDSSPAILEGYGEEYEHVQKTTSFKDVLKHPGISQVAIAAPALLHFALAKEALGAGKDVFVEKPLCLEENEAQELAAMAAQTGRVLMVGHLLQYHPCIQQLQVLLAQGELGKLQYITSNRLNLGKIRREENALWSFAPHDISVILSLVGNQLPEQVVCTGGAYLTQSISDTTLSAFRFSGGIRAHVYVSWLNPFKEQKLTVVGSTGMAVFDDTKPWKEKLILYRHYLTWKDGHVPTPNRAPGELIEIPESEPLQNECQHFIQCCHERRAPRTDGLEGLRVLQVLRAAQASLEREGEAIRPLQKELALKSASSKQEEPLPSSRPNQIPGPYVHPTAVVDEGAAIGKGTKIWHFCHVMKGAQIGERCVLGQNVNVDGGTRLGNNVKVQNNVSIYTGLEIEDDVFLGPSCVLTNVSNPRSQVNRHRLYEKTIVKRGATIGANATIVCGITLGRYCFIAAGAVVTQDVPDYALMAGVPAKQKGWMSRHGHILKPGHDGLMICPESGFRYRLLPDSASPGLVLRCLDLDEESPLSLELSEGKQSYQEFKSRPPLS